jgi:hypothetical protein
LSLDRAPRAVVEPLLPYTGRPSGDGERRLVVSQDRCSAPAFEPAKAYRAIDLCGQMQQVGGPCAGVNLIHLPAVD